LFVFDKLIIQVSLKFILLSDRFLSNYHANIAISFWSTCLLSLSAIVFHFFTKFFKILFQISLAVFVCVHIRESKMSSVVMQRWQ